MTDDNPTELKENRLAFDTAKQSLVEVVDTDVGTLGEQKEAMKDLILNADGNQAIGVSGQMRCVEVKYIGIDQGGRTYTMPVSRIKTSPNLIEAAAALTQDAGIAERVHEQLSANPTLDDYL